MFSSSQVETAASGGFFSSQLTQNSDSTLSSAKSRDVQPMVPVTVKQLNDEVQASDDKSSFVVDDVNVNVMLLGMAFDKSAKVTDVSFVIDDGTGRIDCHRWINDAVDTKEVEEILDGTYVRVHGHLKSYQGKLKLEIFAIRRVTNYDEVSNHFISCIHYHFYRSKRNGAAIPTAVNVPSSTPSDVYQASSQSQFSREYSMDGLKDIDKRIIEYLEQPSSVEQEKGVHRNEIAKHLKLPLEKILEAIEALESEGLVYSTIDECHYKSTGSG